MPMSGNLLLAEDDPAFGQVVRGELNLHPIAGQDADEELAHLAGHDAQDLVVRVVEAELEHCVGQCGGDSCFDFDRLGLGHKVLRWTITTIRDAGSYGVGCTATSQREA